MSVPSISKSVGASTLSGGDDVSGGTRATTPQAAIDTFEGARDTFYNFGWWNGASFSEKIAGGALAAAALPGYALMSLVGCGGEVGPFDKIPPKVKEEPKLPEKPSLEVSQTHWDEPTSSLIEKVYNEGQPANLFTSIDCDEAEQCILAGSVAGNSSDFFAMFVDAFEPRLLGYYSKPNKDEVLATALIGGMAYLAGYAQDNQPYLLIQQANAAGIINPTEQRLSMPNMSGGQIKSVAFNQGVLNFVGSVRDPQGQDHLWQGGVDLLGNMQPSMMQVSPTEGQYFKIRFGHDGSQVKVGYTGKTVSHLYVESEGPTTWSYTEESTIPTQGFDLWPTSDGGAIVVGIQTETDRTPKGILWKINSQGQLILRREFATKLGVYDVVSSAAKAIVCKDDVCYVAGNVKLDDRPREAFLATFNPDTTLEPISPVSFTPEGEGRNASIEAADFTTREGGMPQLIVAGNSTVNGDASQSNGWHAIIGL